MTLNCAIYALNASGWATYGFTRAYLHYFDESYLEYEPRLIHGLIASNGEQTVYAVSDDVNELGDAIIETVQEILGVKK